MHHVHNSDFNVRSGTHIFIGKDLTTANTSYSRSSEYLVTNSSESLISFGDPRLPRAPERPPVTVLSYREPEFIETDFTAPLAEVVRPLSLNALNGDFLSKESRGQLAQSKRPYSANQIQQELMSNKSSTYLNMPNTISVTNNANEMLKFTPSVKGFPKIPDVKHRYSDCASNLDKTPIAPSTKSVMMICSQKSSPSQTGGVVLYGTNQKFKSILPKSAQHKLPNLMVNPAMYPNRSAAGAIKISSQPDVSKNFLSVYPQPFKSSPNLTSPIPKYHIHSPVAITPPGRDAISSSTHSSPLNLSYKNCCDKKETHLTLPNNLFCNSASPEKDAKSKQQELLPVPLNLVSKKKGDEDSTCPTDLSLQTNSLGCGQSGRSLPKFAQEEIDAECSKPLEVVENANDLPGVSFAHEHLKQMAAPSSNSCLTSDALNNIVNVSSVDDKDASSCAPPITFSNLDTSSFLDVPLSEKLKSSVTKDSDSSVNDSWNIRNSEEIEHFYNSRNLQGSEYGLAQVESDDNKFTWDDYLEFHQATAAPSALFKHVESSLQNGLKKGMMVEVANKDSVGTYWVASIIMSCGQLLMLRPACCQNCTSLDFWCDMSTYELHPIGWCTNNNKSIRPPNDLVDKVMPDWESTLEDTLTDAVTPPSYMLDQKTGSLPFDQIHVDMLYEVQHKVDPNTLWFARVVENVGGRLLLRYENLNNSSKTFWLFYTNHRLHPLGWSNKNKKTLQPPREIIKESPDVDWINMTVKYLGEAESNCPPLEIFKDQEDIEKHSFEEGWRLELLDLSSSTFKVAHVSNVIDELYFIVETDIIPPSSESPLKCCCHKNSTIIFPIRWCKEQNLLLSPVPGYDPGEKCEFDWSKYLEQISSSPAPSDSFSKVTMSSNEFEKDQKLEAVDRMEPHLICVATIKDVKGPLLSIKLDHNPSSVMLFSFDCHELFPIGWCESNNYQLKAPIHKPVEAYNGFESESVSKNPCASEIAITVPKKTSGWCPKIYFNTKCYSGPFLTKWKLHLLPKSIGPGLVVSVMTAVLTKLVGSAYKSSRVLRELQLDGSPRPGMHQQILKTKYNMKNYSAPIEICTSDSQVDKFCRDICRRLLCCPNLISTHPYPSVCPENCLKIAKSKHYFHFGERKRQIGRPRGGHSNIEHASMGQKSGVHKRKKRHKKKLLLTLRKKHGPNVISILSNLHSEVDASSPEGNDNTSQFDAISNRGEKIEERSQISSECPSVDGEPNAKPRETLKKLKLVCNQELEDGIRSYVVCDDSKDVAIVKNSCNKRKYKSYDGEPSYKKRKGGISKKYEVQTRGISLTKNYSFERRTHKKIYIIPPTPPVNQLTSSPQMLKVPPVEPSSSKDVTIKLNSSETSDPGKPLLQLLSNPADWSVQQVVDFIKTTDCTKLSRIFKEQEIDGKSLLLLTLPTVQEFIEPKLGPAVKLCDLVERLKKAFFCKYATTIIV